MLLGIFIDKNILSIFIKYLLSMIIDNSTVQNASEFLADICMMDYTLHYHFISWSLSYSFVTSINIKEYQGNETTFNLKVLTK